MAIIPRTEFGKYREKVLKKIGKYSKALEFLASFLIPEETELGIMPTQTGIPVRIFHRELTRQVLGEKIDLPKVFEKYGHFRVRDGILQPGLGGYVKIYKRALEIEPTKRKAGVRIATEIEGRRLSPLEQLFNLYHELTHWWLTDNPVAKERLIKNYALRLRKEYGKSLLYLEPYIKTVLSKRPTEITKKEAIEELSENYADYVAARWINHFFWTKSK